jgi:hypothetical protein
MAAQQRVALLLCCELLSQLFVQGSRLICFGMQLAAQFIEVLFSGGPLHIADALLSFQVGLLFVELLRKRLQLAFAAGDLLLARFQIQGARFQRVGRSAGGGQAGGGVLQRLGSVIEFLSAPRQLLLLFTLPQPERALLIVVERRARVEHRLASGQVSLTGRKVLGNFGRLLLHLLSGEFRGSAGNGEQDIRIGFARTV